MTPPCTSAAPFSQWHRVNGQRVVDRGGRFAARGNLHKLMSGDLEDFLGAGWSALSTTMPGPLDPHFVL